MPTPQADDLLTSSETAAILGIRLNTLEIWRIRGNGPAYVKFGDHDRAPVRYRRSDVIAWIEARLRTSTSAHSAQLAAAQRSVERTVLPPSRLALQGKPKLKPGPKPKAETPKVQPSQGVAPNAPWLKNATA